MCVWVRVEGHSYYTVHIVFKTVQVSHTHLDELCKGLLWNTCLATLSEFSFPCRCHSQSSASRSH